MSAAPLTPGRPGAVEPVCNSIVHQPILRVLPDEEITGLKLRLKVLWRLFCRIGHQLGDAFSVAIA